MTAKLTLALLVLTIRLSAVEPKVEQVHEMAVPNGRLTFYRRDVEMTGIHLVPKEKVADAGHITGNVLFYAVLTRPNKEPSLLWSEYVTRFKGSGTPKAWRVSANRDAGDGSVRIGLVMSDRSNIGIDLYRVAPDSARPIPVPAFEAKKPDTWPGRTKPSATYKSTRVMLATTRIVERAHLVPMQHVTLFALERRRSSPVFLRHDAKLKKWEWLRLSAEPK